MQLYLRAAENGILFYFFIHHFTNGIHCKKEIAFVVQFFRLECSELQVFVPAAATTLDLVGENQPGKETKKPGRVQIPLDSIYFYSL